MRLQCEPVARLRQNVWTNSAWEELAVAWMAHSPGSIRWKYRQMINGLVYQALVD